MIGGGFGRIRVIKGLYLEEVGSLGQVYGEFVGGREGGGEVGNTGRKEVVFDSDFESGNLFAVFKVHTLVT